MPWSQDATPTTELAQEARSLDSFLNFSVVDADSTPDLQASSSSVSLEKKSALQNVDFEPIAPEVSSSNLARSNLDQVNVHARYVESTSTVSCHIDFLNSRGLYNDWSMIMPKF